jgi:hypothetical protein
LSIKFRSNLSLQIQRKQNNAHLIISTEGYFRKEWKFLDAALYIYICTLSLTAAHFRISYSDGNNGILSKRHKQGAKDSEQRKSSAQILAAGQEINTRWFKYDWDYLCVNKSQFVQVIFEPPCICRILRDFTPKLGIFLPCGFKHSINNIHDNYPLRTKVHIFPSLNGRHQVLYAYKTTEKVIVLSSNSYSYRQQTGKKKIFNGMVGLPKLQKKN